MGVQDKFSAKGATIAHGRISGDRWFLLRHWLIPKTGKQRIDRHKWSGRVTAGNDGRILATCEIKKSTKFIPLKIILVKKWIGKEKFTSKKDVGDGVISDLDTLHGLILEIDAKVNPKMDETEA